MTTICFFTENTEYNNSILVKVYMTFGCFIMAKNCMDNYKEVTIKARTEDIVAIMDMIGEIV